MMGAMAVDLLDEGKSKRLVGWRDGKFYDVDINEGLAMQKTLPPYQVEVAKLLSH